MGGVEKAEDGGYEAGVAVNLNKEDAKLNLMDLPEPVPITTLFRFCTTGDLGIFFFGLFMSVLAAATLPSIMIVFGDVMDAIAEPVNIEELVGDACLNMVLVGIYGFITFFFGFFAAGMSAAKVANSYRTAFLEAVLRQDGTFFDHVEPGSVSLMLSDCALDIQTGLADKFASSVQGLFQLFFGFAVAFYYGPLLSLVCLACLPFLVSVAAAIGFWGAEDGIFGKEAYNSANSIASESLLNVRTVFSLNAETVMSKRYDSKLEACKTAAIRQSARAAFLSGLLFLVMFAMYGIGLWYGAELIADSTDEELKQHPPPADLFNPTGEWATQYAIFAGTDDTPGICAPFLEVDPVTNTTIVTDPLSVCACGLPWDSIDDVPSPECGCSFDGENTGFGTGCFTGGKTILVFFAIMLGGFGAGQVGPGVKTFNDARQSAAKMLKVIDRHPQIDIHAVQGKKRLQNNNVQGQIVLDNMHFRYAPKPVYSKPADKDEDDKAGPNNPAGDDKKDDPPPVDHYEEGKLVFSGCNLTIEAGQTVALVGESGCGKSTIAKLVQRFYDPTQGRILLDGTDLKDIALKDLRANIGVVSQEPLLFDKSIKENIRYGKMDATDEEIVRAAKSANAHGFISRFPDAYDTRVGPKGSKLSGGQKQRVAIARAILRNPAILILDEATSALDNKSEKIVQQALDDLVQAKDSAKRTTIVIAHRLSTVRNADKIVVLGSPEGTSTATTGSIILEQGSHDELMAKEGGFYKALVGFGQRRNTTAPTEQRFNTQTSEVDVDAMPAADAADEVDIDDLIQKTSGDENNKTAVADENTETESIYSLSTNKTEEKEEEVGFWAQLTGGGGEKKEPEDPLAAEKLKEYNNRVWNYTKPEMPWILFGSLASILKGSIFPLLSIVFSEMITVYYDSDTERLREDALRWSYLFYVIGIASLVFETIQKCVFEMVGERLTQRMRSDLFRSFLRQDLSWFEDDANSLGVLASCLSTDVKLVRLVGGQSTAATVESVSALCFGIAISLEASWEIFLIMLAMVPILGVCEALQWMALMGSEGSIRSELSSSTDKLHETVNGIREVQAFSLERSIATELQASITDQIIPASKTSAIMKGFMMGALQLIQFSVYAFAFWFGGQMIVEGRINFEDFNTALWAMAFAASGLGQAAIFAGDAAKASAAVKNIFDRLDAVPKIPSEPWENRGLQDFKTGDPVERKIDTQVLKDGTAELEKVNFAYPTRRGAKIFDQIDLTIPAGKAVALVGSSGSGKSTVVQLLERFYDPISYKEEVEEEGTEATKDVETGAVGLSFADGTVRFNSADMREADVRWIRQNMALVGQEPVLFDDTIYNNIAMGKPGCTKQEVEGAAKKANAYEFIMKMENGFDSKVGTAGGKVSGGQKQRIAIARAIINNPKILLLDEATSALDNESEKIVQASLDALVEESGGERTTLIIAHRLSTIKQADIICVLENNGDGSKVCESGSHEELMELGGKYKALIEAYER